MLRICHVQVLPILSGVQRAMLEIFRHLDRSRIEPHVICQQAGPLTEELARQGICYHTVPALDRPIHPARDAQAYGELFRLFRRHRYDLVHTHSSKPGILGRIAARRAGVPCVVHHVHAFAFNEFSSRRATWTYRRLEKLAGHFCDRVLFVNHEERRLAVETGLLPVEKCLTVQNGIDLSPYTTFERARLRQPWRTRLGIRPDEIALLFIGRLDNQKQPLILPKIADALRNFTPPARWKLIVAGDGPLAGSLAREVQSLGLGDSVRLVGWQPEPSAMFHAADILVQPSLWEGLPLTVLEGHAAGLATVASDICGTREVVTAETGFLCAPRDPLGYAAALARLIEQPALRSRMGHAARTRAATSFDGAVNMRQIARLYDDWLGQVPAAVPLRRAA